MAITGKFTNDLFYGVPDVEYVNHGGWADPEVIYKDKTFNYWEVENGLQDFYDDDMEGLIMCGAEKIEFEDWIKDHYQDVYSLLDDMIYANQYTYDFSNNENDDEMMEHIHFPIGYVVPPIC